MSICLLPILLKQRSQPTIPRDATPDWTVRFEYDEDDFEASSTSLPVNISSKLLTKTRRAAVKSVQVPEEHLVDRQIEDGER